MLVSEKIIEAKKIPLHKKPKTKDKATSSPQKVEKTSDAEEIKKNQQETAK
jgi:hypothetical protein